MPANETMTQRSAQRLARRIASYWRERGYDGIKTTLEKQTVEWLDDRENAPIWIVKTNIGPRGYPPRQAA